jgi:hypothetical protein
MIVKSPTVRVFVYIFEMSKEASLKFWDNVFIFADDGPDVAL